MTKKITHINAYTWSLHSVFSYSLKSWMAVQFSQWEGSPGVSSSWRPEECGRLNTRIPPPTHCPHSPYTKRSPKGSGVFTVELEKPRVQGKAGDFAELLRASVLHSSSAWGLWAQRRDRQQSQKAFLQRAAQTRHARLRDGRHVR